jgi:hypothetical protein
VGALWSYGVSERPHSERQGDTIEVSSRCTQHSEGEVVTGPSILLDNSQVLENEGEHAFIEPSWANKKDRDRQKGVQHFEMKCYDKVIAL